MTVMNIDDEAHERIGRYIEKHRIEYPSIKNFVDKNLFKILKKLEEKDKKEEREDKKQNDFTSP